MWSTRKLSGSKDNYSKVSSAPARKIFRWVLVGAWAAGIWVLSSLPDLKTDLPEDFLLRKIAHAVVFGILSLLALWAMHGNAKRKRLRFGLIGLAGLAALLYAVVDEFHQTFVPGRYGAPTDVLIDGAGIVLALALAHLFLRLAPLPKAGNIRYN